MKKEMRRLPRFIHTFTHPFLVKTSYIFHNDTKLYYLFELIKGKPLLDYIQEVKNKQKIDENAIRFYAAELIVAIEYLLEQDYVYRDFKPDNVLIDETGHLRLTAYFEEETDKSFSRADFSFLPPEIIVRLEKHQKSISQSNLENVIAAHSLAKEWEIFHLEDKTAIWWSVGVFLYTLLLGRNPFHDDDIIIRNQKIMNSNAYLKFPEEISKKCKTFLLELLHPNPCQRLTDTSRIKTHPFFEGVKWDKVLGVDYEPPFQPHFKEPRQYFTRTNAEFSIHLASESSIDQTSLLITPVATLVAPDKENMLEGFTLADSSMFLSYS